MILTGERIKRAITTGEILISPFTKEQLNPNSYNLRLDPTLLVYTEVDLDAKDDNRYKEVTIPEKGLVLEPGELYLGSTYEYTETHSYIPKIDGRSSMGRLGVFVHITAGFGDVGFRGHWTLEIACIKPVRIYPMMEICQISYHMILGPITQRYDGRYQNNDGVQPSRLHLPDPPTSQEQ